MATAKQKAYQHCLGKEGKKPFIMGPYGKPRLLPESILKALRLYFTYTIDKPEIDRIVKDEFEKNDWSYFRMAGSFYLTDGRTGLSYYADKDTIPYGIRLKGAEKNRFSRKGILEPVESPA